MNLSGKTALVTASTRGIGLAIVKKLASEGATVYMAARRLDYADSLAEEMKQNGWKVKSVYFDATDPSCYETMCRTVFEQEGHLDILVNNFGTSNPREDRTIEDTSWQTFQETVSIDLQSVFSSSQRAIPYMKISGGGSIINISSVAGNIPDISQIAYGTSKAAINYLTKLIALQEGQYQIRCNAVLPGMTATDAVKDNLSDQFRSIFLKQTPLQRMAEPEEIAAAVAYFASDDAAFVTGQILSVSGGFGLGTPVYGDLMNSSSLR